MDRLGRSGTATGALELWTEGTRAHADHPERVQGRPGVGLFELALEQLAPGLSRVRPCAGVTVSWSRVLTTPTEQVFYGWMATKRTPTGWAIRCEGCDRTDAMDAATTAQETMAQAATRGWARPRPGLNDYCPTCIDARC